MINYVTANSLNNPLLDDRSRAPENVFWHYHPNIVPQYHQSATSTLVDYQSDQYFRHLHSQFAVENTLASSCPYETPFYPLAIPWQNSMVRHNHDGSVETQPGPLLSLQTVTGIPSHLSNQASASDAFMDIRDDAAQPSRSARSEVLETQSASPLASPSTGSGYEFVESVSGMFYRTVHSGNHRLLELSITIGRHSMDAEIRFAVEKCESARSEYEQHSKAPGQSLTEELTRLTEEALEIPGEHEFRIHSDESSTKIDIRYSNNAS